MIETSTVMRLELFKLFAYKIYRSEHTKNNERNGSPRIIHIPFLSHCVQKKKQGSVKVRSSNLSRRFIFRRTFPTFRLDKKYLPRHSTRISTFHSISPVNDSKPLSRFIQTNEVSPRLIRFPSVDPRISGIMSAFEQLPAGYFFTRSITMTRLFTPRLEALHG